MVDAQLRKNPCATAPVPIAFLEAEQRGTPAFDRNSRPFSATTASGHP